MAITTAIKTFALANGVLVLANYDSDPLHFSGYRSADRRAAELRADGINASAYESAYRRNLYYVSISDAPLPLETVAYQLPDGRIVQIDRELCRAASVIDFTLEGGRVVMAVIAAGER